MKAEHETPSIWALEQRELAINTTSFPKSYWQELRGGAGASVSFDESADGESIINALAPSR